jgi:hypothetical protein
VEAIGVTHAFLAAQGPAVTVESLGTLLDELTGS